MSFRIIIADDEYFIRQRIKKIISWEQLDLSFAGEAENGLQVLELMEQNPADIILLDIKMPKMNGLEVCQHLSLSYPNSKIIILSGYNDFEYARTALKYGVTDYLLKPIKKETLYDSLKECTKKIKKNMEEQYSMKQWFHYKKCTHLTNMLNSDATLEQLFQCYPELKHYSYTIYVGAFFNDITTHCISILMEQLRLEDFYCEYFKETEYSYIIQLFLTHKTELQQLKTIMEQLLSNCSCYTFLYLGTLFEVGENWTVFYKKVVYSLNYRYFYTKSLLYLETNAKPVFYRYETIAKIRKTIIFFINIKEEQQFEQYLDNLFLQIQESHNIDYLYLALTELFVTYQIHYFDATSNCTNMTEWITLMLEEEYQLDALKFVLLSYGKQFMQQNEAIPSDIILSRKIITYIEENFQNTELSVAQLASIFQLNASYMGTVFKKIHHTSILQYITTVRMQASKKLLAKKQYKISDIAQMVGYSDVFYFSKRFKKFYGCSPKEHNFLE